MTAVGEVRRDWNRPGYDVEPATEQTAPAGMTIVKALQQGHRAEVWLDGGTGPRACVGLVGIQLQGWWHTAGSAEQWAEAYNSACDHMRAAFRVNGCPESGKHCKVIDGDCQTCGLAGAQALAPHLPKVLDEATLERAKAIYAKYPVWRGPRKLPWQEAPSAVRQECLKKAADLTGIDPVQSRRLADTMRQLQLKLHGTEFNDYRAAILCGAGALVLLAEIAERATDVPVGVRGS